MKRSMEHSAFDFVDSHAQPLDVSPPTGSKSDKLPLALCWGGLVLFLVSLSLPALRVQERGEWIAGDPGYVCVILGASLCWLGLAAGIGLGRLPFTIMSANETSFTLVSTFVLYPLSFSLLAMAPLVCTFCGPLARRIVGVLVALPAIGITLAIVLGGLNQLGPVAFVFSAAWWPHLLSAAGLLSLDMRSGKKVTVVPDGGQLKARQFDHSLE